MTLRLIWLWQQHAPTNLQPAIPPLGLSALADLPIARTPITRQQRLQAVVTVVHWVVDGVTPHLDALPDPTRTAVQAYLDDLAKVQADDLSTGGFVTERDSQTTAHQCRRSRSDVPQPQ